MFGASAAFRAVAATIVALVLAWQFGGQQALGRIDPALALPLLSLPALLLAWSMRREAKPLRWRAVGLALAMILILQALLATFLSARPPWPQLGLVAIAWAVVALAADALLQWQRGRVVRLLLAAALVAGWFIASHALLAMLYRPVAARGPAVIMLTGLPLRWSEGNDLAAVLARGMNEDPALARLRQAGSVELVDSIVDNPPRKGSVLFLAHPRALAPQELVAIDAFVRGGGRAVILADALTGWPMRHPIGDPRNPPVTSLLTPLFDHWGVALAAASPGDRGALAVDVGNARLQLFSAGRFERLPLACRAHANRHIAMCPIGKGQAWIVGDADLLFAPLWQPQPIWADHLRRADTMEWLASHLWVHAPEAALQPLWIRTSAG
ncbi:Gldg family protein [Sphingopyxis sp.]|uniref:Gldg family protein n=1 Tax=Sphingopyxis sp. TaxID=1908224 RepID=UPI003BABFB65